MSDDVDLAVTPAVLDALVENHRRFLAFLRPRMNSNEDAEELLQDAFVRAVDKGKHLRNDESAVAWFYRLLRNALTDYYRRRDVARRALEALSTDAAEPVIEPELEQTVCRCVNLLLTTLKPDQARLLEQVEVEGRRVIDAAQELGISENSASVKLYRARQALKARLEQSCGTCATHGCLDCTCQTCE